MRNIAHRIALTAATIALSTTIAISAAPISSAAGRTATAQPLGFRDAICYWWPGLCG